MDAGTSPVDALLPALALLGAGAATGLAARAVRLSPIVGYLIAGILIGPHALGFIRENETTHLLAELGVVFLLFDIGLHVSMREIRSGRSDFLGLAPLHLLMTGALSAFALTLAGLDLAIAIAVGLSLALSSTAVVARILTERDQTFCPIGRSATHVLIFQDLIAIFLMIYATSLGGADQTAHGLARLVSEQFLNGAALPVWAAMGLALVQTAIAFVTALMAGKFLINPLFRVLTASNNAEAFTAVTLLMVLAAACATALLGLSLTLGAFLAGLAISGTPWRHEVQTEMSPFRGLLLSFFFVSVGLSLDVPKLLVYLPFVIAFALGLLILKSVIGYAAARLTGWSAPGAAQISFLLAQGSEFTLVILSLAAMTAALPSGLMSVLVAGVALSLALAPVWAGFGQKLARRFAGEAAPQAEDASGERPVIVIGMTPAGRLAVDALSTHGVPYVATEYDPGRLVAAVSDGYRVSFGDASNLKLIDAIGGANARAVVLGLARVDVSREVTPAVQRKFPGILRFAAVSDPADVTAYAEMGVRAHVSLTEPEGIEMVADLLQQLGVDADAVARWMITTTEGTQIGEVTLDDVEEDAAVA